MATRNGTFQVRRTRSTNQQTKWQPTKEMRPTTIRQIYDLEKGAEFFSSLVLCRNFSIVHICLQECFSKMTRPPPPMMSNGTPLILIAMSEGFIWGGALMTSVLWLTVTKKIPSTTKTLVFTFAGYYCVYFNVIFRFLW